MVTGLRACHACGLVQRVGVAGERARWLCARCGATVRHARRPRSLARAGAFALAALVLYPPAMALPVIHVQGMGHSRSATIWSGVVELLASGEWLVGVVVFLCSMVIPLTKIGVMFVLCAGGSLVGAQPRMFMYRAMEWIGRWGMIDVLLVAVLVAAVKLGNWMQVQPGPGTLAFMGVVVMSLAASASFDPASIWEESA